MISPRENYEATFNCRSISFIQARWYVLVCGKSKGLKDIPEALMERFGKGISAMTMLLTNESKLARATPEKVASEIREKGFYLQLPPVKDDYLLDLYKTPTQAVY
ncbi:YcgL domain-containing protein [Marinomonas rhodophyticola]|uniref:YcgL domain-containing protein n=1 Tax=Marinomonas rhodophyticola TaxID=2992803 RepID=UPI003D17B8A8